MATIFGQEFNAGSAAVTAFDLFNSSAAVDTVSVLNSSLQQVFPEARPMRVSVREYCRTLDHPIESGQIITDYSVIMPMEIDYQAIIEARYYRAIYQEIRSLFFNKELLSVQTRSGNYQNMIIAEMPHEETPDLFDALPISIRLRQVQVVQSTPVFAPADKVMSSTQSIGEQTGTIVTGVAGSDGVISFSSVPKRITSASGIASEPLTPTFNPLSTSNVEVTGVQTMTSQYTVGAGFK